MMKGTKTIWTEAMLKSLTEGFATRITADICKEIGVSLRTAIRKARELGLEKEDGFLDNKREEITSRAAKALRSKAKQEGSWGFQKGAHYCPECEFHKGQKPPVVSAEVRARVAYEHSMRMRMMFWQEKIRMKYGLPRETKLRIRKYWHTETLEQLKNR